MLRADTFNPFEPSFAVHGLIDELAQEFSEVAWRKVTPPQMKHTNKTRLSAEQAKQWESGFNECIQAWYLQAKVKDDVGCVSDLHFKRDIAFLAFALRQHAEQQAQKISAMPFSTLFLKFRNQQGFGRPTGQTFKEAVASKLAHYKSHPSKKAMLFIAYEEILSAHTLAKSTLTEPRV